MRKRDLRPSRLLAWLIMIAVIVVTVFPFWWMIRTAITPAADLYTDNSDLLPRDPTLINFARVLGLTTEAEARAAMADRATLEARQSLARLKERGLLARLLNR